MRARTRPLLNPRRLTQRRGRKFCRVYGLARNIRHVGENLLYRSSRRTGGQGLRELANRTMLRRAFMSWRVLPVLGTVILQCHNEFGTTDRALQCGMRDRNGPTEDDEPYGQNSTQLRTPKTACHAGTARRRFDMLGDRC